jgi:predicted ATPase
MCAFSYGAQIAAVLGHFDESIRLLGEGVVLARNLAHPPSMASALADAADVRVFRREPLEVEALFGLLFPLVSKHGSAVGVANAKMLHGWALIATNRVKGGLVELRSGLEAWRATGSKFWVPYRLGRAAAAFFMAGLAEEGQRHASEAMKAMKDGGDRWYGAELNRLQGDMALAAGDRGEAEASYRRAIALAREQSARLFELRSANSLTRLWRGRGQAEKARELLEPIYAWFTDGFDIVDMKEARTLLDELH